MRKAKPPAPRYHYKLATVTGSQQARLTEDALREQLTRLHMSYFAIGHEGGSYDVMGDSGSNALADADLHDARAIAAKFNKMASV